MRKDIQAINEAYQKATSIVTENVAPQRSLKDLMRGYKNSFESVLHDTYLSEDDYPDNPTTVLYAFRYVPASEGDYDTPGTSPEIDFLGAFLNDETAAPVEVAEEDIHDARVELMNELGIEY
jgi:hypothetical protein